MLLGTMVACILGLFRVFLLFLWLVDTSSCTPGDVRLVGRPSTGRLEVCWRSRWGSVCSSQFDRLDAAVVCRQLNLPSEGEF